MVLAMAILVASLIVAIAAWRCGRPEAPSQRAGTARLVPRRAVEAGPNVGGLTRRTWIAGLLGLGWLGPSPTRPQALSTSQGFEAGLFTQLPSTLIPSTAQLIRTVGYSTSGRGAAHYRLDPDQASGRSSRIRARSLDGRWFVLAEDQVDITMTGALGDGRTDDTDAIQAAVDLGGIVIVPAARDFFRISTPITLRSHSEIRGAGPASRIVQQGAGASAGVFFGDRQPGISLAGLSIRPGPSLGGFLEGHAVFLRDCSELKIHDMLVDGHRRGGITLLNCENAEVRRCEVASSVAQQGATDHTESGCDILITQGGRNILIADNHCVRGAGIGIAVQSFAPDDMVRFQDVRIDNNHIERQGCYGVLVYRRLASTFENVVVSGNIVEGISGIIPQAQFGAVFGAGIYVQGVDDVRILANHVRLTNTATRRESLAPAGIGIANATAVEITDNQVEDCAWYGICVFDPNREGSPDGVARLTRNSVRRSGKSGIYCKDIASATLLDNLSADNGEHGFLVQSTGRGRAIRITLSSSEFANNHEHGIFFLAGDGRLIGNNVHDNQGDGILLGAPGHFELSRNRVIGNGGFGLNSPVANTIALEANDFQTNRRGPLSLVGPAR